MKKSLFIFFIYSTFCSVGKGLLAQDYTLDAMCSTAFEDISGTGTALGLTDDGEANITSPFAFTFYGNSSTDFRIANNGGILFDATTGDVSSTNTSLTSGDNAIYPFWDDIDDNLGDVFWEVRGTAPNRRLIIQWNDRDHFNASPSGATFQVVLYESTNEITFVYQDLIFGTAEDDGASATVGLEGPAATTANEFSFDATFTNTCLNFVPLGCSATLDVTHSNLTYCFGDTPQTLALEGFTVNSFDAGPNAVPPNDGVVWAEICAASWDNVGFPNPTDDPNYTGFLVADAYAYNPGQANGTDGEGTNCDYITLVPMTHIDIDAITLNFIIDPTCFATGTPVILEFRPEITSNVVVYDCLLNQCIITPDGGAQDDGVPIVGNYTVEVFTGTGPTGGVSQGSMVIADGSSATYLALANGDYYYIVTDSEGCMETFTSFTVNCCSADSGTFPGN